MGQGTAYDFQSLQRPAPPQLRRLRTLFAGVARDFGVALSALLRSPVAVRLADVEQRTYGEFAYNLTTPACFYLLTADPPNERLMLDIEPCIVYPMIDRLLGGGHEDEPPPCRPLTEIEERLAARIVRLFLQEVHRAWKSSLDLKLDVLRAESNPRLLRVLPADEMVIVTGFELGIGELRGMMRLCLPSRAIERMDNQGLCENRAPADALVAVEVTLAETPIAGRDLTGLGVGDIISTETEMGSPAIVSIAGVAKFRAKPGMYQGHKAAVLAEEIEGSPPATRDR